MKFLKYENVNKADPGMKGGIYRRGDERWNIQERRKCDSSWL
jgi:hypothetical protein